MRSAPVVLAVIGRWWLTATDPATGQRRIDDVDDWIRRELAEAFAAAVRVIPVLTDHAELPREADLPADIAALSRCQYRRLRHREPTSDLARLVADLIRLDPTLVTARPDHDGGSPADTVARRSGLGPASDAAVWPRAAVMDVVGESGTAETAAWAHVLGNPGDPHPDHLAFSRLVRVPWRAGGGRDRNDSLSGVDEWAEGLARGVQTLWRREEGHRRVHDPVALPVRWHPAIAELADHWANVRRVPAGAIAEPLALAGRIEDLAEVYRRIPSRRLVILGPAGAGKTVLAGRLALDLLVARQPGQPVPIIVSAGSWNPVTTPLNAWLATQLARDHPGLAVRVGRGGSTRAAAVIEAGRVLPILDGFDEMDAGLHQAAMHQFNITPDAPVVITSRVAEYTAAVRGTDVLTAAAVIELDDLTLEDLAAYLPRTAAGHRAGMWDSVLNLMRAPSDAPGPALLGRVLTNPLMVFLARTVYSDAPGRDPTELLDTQRFPSAQSVQEHLLAAFVPAIYQADQPGRSRRWWPADRAHWYLICLASHLHHAGTRDLAWWQLRDTIPRWQRTLVFAAVDGLLVGLTFGLAGGFKAGLTPELVVGLGPKYGNMVGIEYAVVVGIEYGFVVGLAAMLASGLTVAITVGLTRGLHKLRRYGVLGFLSDKFPIVFGTGLTVGLLAGLTFGVKGWLANGLTVGLAVGLAAGLIGLRRAGPKPTRTRLQIRGRVRFVAGRLVLGFALGFVAGFVAGIAVGLVAGIAAGLAFGFAGGLVVVVAFGLETPLNPAEVIGAAESLARDRRNAIRKMLAVGLAVGVMGSFTNGGLVDGLAFGPAAAIVIGFVSVRATSAWIYWMVLVRGWLPVAGRLPWRVQAFLTDAYRRGVLRQTGAVYQFRHVQLQDQLTAEPLPAMLPADR